jgi:hypothetical protein
MFILVQKVIAVIAHSLVVFGGFCFFQGAGAHGLQTSLEESRFQIQLKNSFLQDEDSLFTAAGYLKKLVAGAAPEFEIRQEICRLGSQDYAQRQKAEAYLFSAPVLPSKFRSEFASLEDMQFI